MFASLLSTGLCEPITLAAAEPRASAEPVASYSAKVHISTAARRAGGMFLVALHVVNVVHTLMLSSFLRLWMATQLRWPLTMSNLASTCIDCSGQKL